MPPLLQVLVAAVLLFVPLTPRAEAGAVASDPPECPPPETVTEYPLADVAADCDTPVFRSQCWNKDIDWSNCASTGITLAPGESEGFPLNLSLRWGPTPGDFPPRSLDPGKGSSPLLPAARAAAFTGPASYAERPMLSGTLDLITGAPLVQQVDFELPFGGAVFRHVRTYSVHPYQFRPWGGCPPTADAAMWDWHGIGWMMGESPILLVDAAYADIVGDSPRRCYLIADAHHSVPFELTPEGHYLAPPHFDARMSHNGIGWNPTTGEWAAPPTEFTIWLHSGSVRYFFRTQSDVRDVNGRRQYSDIPDVPTDGQPLSAHARPDPASPQNGFFPQGIPRYALLDRIEDQNGNVAKIFYCGFNQTGAYDDPDPSSPCAECLQNCTEKGQIQGIKLYAASDPGTAVWTLLYTYRSFWAAPYALGETIPMLGWWEQLGHEEFLGRSQNAVHSIHVYRGDRPLPGACTVLGNRHFIQHYETGIAGDFEQYTFGHGFTSLDQLDEIDTLGAVNLPPGHDFSDWVYEAKYNYSERAQGLHSDGDVRRSFGYEPGAPTIFDQATFTRGNGPHGPTLLKVTVTRRHDQGAAVGGEAAVTSEATLLRYTTPAGRGPELQAIYNPSTVRAITDARFPPPLDPQMPEHARVNALQDILDDELVSIFDSGTDSTISRPFRELADVWLETETWGTYQFVRSDTCAEMLGYISEGGAAGGARLCALAPQTAVFASRSDGGAFRVHQFLRLHTDGTLDSGEHVHGDMSSLVPNNPIRSMLHHPYRWHGMIPGDADGLPASPLDETTWITVLDRFPTLAEARGANSGGSYRPTGRRVVKMNAAGHVLSDREWTLADDGAGELVGSLGVSEELIFDEDRGYRVKSRRTIGFTSPHNTNGTDGLIYNYYYGDEGNSSGPWSRLIQEIRIQRGDNEVDVEIPLSRVERNESDWPELVTASVVFEDDGTERRSEIEYGLEQVDAPASGERGTFRIRSKWSVEPAAPALENGPPLHPVRTESYDEDGRMTWSGRGLVADDEVFPAQGDLFHLDYTAHDELGRLLYAIVDVVPTQGVATRRGSVAQHLYEVPAHPQGFGRHDDATAPLNHVTAYGYSPVYGLSEIYFPNGRARVITYSQADIDRLEQRTYESVIFPSAASFQALGGGQSTEIRGGQTGFVRAFLPVGGQVAIPSGLEAITPHSTITPTYDSAGRLTGIDIEGTDGDESVGASVAINDLGMIVRELAPDGTITRTVRDPLGRPTRIYRGTKDQLGYWGYPPNVPEDDNLTLLEKRFYGDGVHDAGRLIKSAMYRDRPSDQYGPATTEDEIGWERHHRYDWRMREVWVEERTARSLQDPDGTPIRHMLTWLDNQDRGRLFAVFGPIAPSLGAYDPTMQTTLPGPQDMPALVSAILAAGPVVLSETTYNARGEVEEQRSYDTASTDPTDYLVTKTYYDHEGRSIWTLQPGGGVRTVVYDAKGRQVESSLAAAGVEVTRTRTTFDVDGNALATEVAERTHDGAGTALDATNSVTTYTFQWHDDAGRVIATADCGTGHESDTFTAAAPPTGPPARTSEPPKWVAPSQVFVADGLPPGLRITLYGYDAAGRQNFVRHPSGSTTTHVFDSLGRVVVTTERAPNDTEVLTQTGYRYGETGQLVEMAAVLASHAFSGDKVNWGANDGSLQRTEFRYGADVVAEADHELVISRHNGWIGSVHFPDPVTGKASTEPDLVFTYYPDGLLATRTDARGVRFSHRYEERGLRAQTDVNDPGIVAPLIDWVKDQQSRIIYAYNARGDLTLATAKTIGSNAPETIIAQNLLEYDGLGNLTREWQAHGGEVDTGVQSPSPSVSYGWAFGASDDGNFNRLSTMTYPAWTHVARQRTLAFHYGNATTDPLSDELNRITRIVASEHGAVASYAYTGSGRRVESVSAPTASTHAARQSFARHHGSGDPPVGYSQLSRFGEVRDLHFTRPALGGGGGGEETLHRYRYGYDAAGNRTFAHAQQWPVAPAVVPAADLSHKYEYDELSRLLGAAVGTVDLGVDPNTDPQPSMPTLAERRRTDWGLDRLGNWAGAGVSVPYGTRLSGDGDLDGAADPMLDTLHVVDLRNRLQEVQTTALGGTPQSKSLVYDAAGNLVCDGPGTDALFYQYDAWNRLVQVSRRGTAVFSAKGEVVGGVPGAWLAHLTYDPMGRLIRRQAPWDSGYVAVRAESYYYDGVRRIQEVWREPLPTEPGGKPTGIGAEPGGGGGGGPVYGERTEREYIHSPGYVDEHVCYIAGDNQAVYVLQDANYNVVGLVEPDGDALAQYTWDPYGRLLVGQVFSAHADNRLGHQGLFSLRLDGSALAGLRTLTPDALGVYHNVNRTYEPTLGRFLQRDPNASGLPALMYMVHGGQAELADIAAFDGRALYGDGLNLYAYLASQPITNRDPAGLDIGLVGQMAVTGISAFLDANGTMDEALAGMITTFSLYDMLASYAFIQELDVDWASDWSASDDWLIGPMENPVADDGSDELASAGLWGKRPGRAVREAGVNSRAYRSAMYSKNFPRKKDAYERAKSLCAPGKEPVLHHGHGEAGKRGWPHFQPVDAGGKIIPGPHFRFPPGQM